MGLPTHRCPGPTGSTATVTMETIYTLLCCCLMNSTGCTLLPDRETLPRRQHCLSSTSLPHCALTVARLFSTVIMCVASHIQCYAAARIIVIILISVVSQSFHLAFALPCLIHFQKIFFFFCFIYLHASFMPTLMGAVAPWTCIGSIHSRVEWSGDIAENQYIAIFGWWMYLLQFQSYRIFPMGLLFLACPVYQCLMYQTRM